MRFPTRGTGLVLVASIVLASLSGCQGETAPPPRPEPALRGAEQRFEQGLNCGANLVPVMTGATVPSGIVTYSSLLESPYEPWKAFDSTDSSMWISFNGDPLPWIAYEWADGAKTVTHYAIKYSNGSTTTRAPRAWTLQGWTGSAWVIVDTRRNEINWGGTERREYPVATPGAYVKYRLSVTEDNDPNTGIGAISIGRLEFFQCGCPTVNVVPAMTGPNAPGGSVSRSSAYSTDYDGWKAFDAVDTAASMWISAVSQAPAWIGYQWASGSRKITRYAIRFANGGLASRAPRIWTLEGWNGSAWVVVDTRLNEVNWGGVERREYPVAFPGMYSKYRLNITDDNDSRTGIEVISLARLELLECQTDFTPPTVPVLTGFTPASPSNTTVSPVLAGTTEAGATVKFFLGSNCQGTPLSTVTAAANGSFSGTLSVAPNTTVTFFASATDAANNVSACSAGLTYTHDSIAPGVPTLTSFSPVSPSNNPTPTLSGTAEAGSTVRVFTGGGCASALLTTVPANATTGAFSLPVTVSANTSTTFSTRAVDAAGNVSPCSSTATYVHDGIAPGMPSLVSGILPFASPPFVAMIRLQTEPGTRVALFSDAACTVPAPSSPEVVVASNGFALMPLLPGQVNAQVFASARDAAGNRSACASFQTGCQAGFGDCDGNPANGCESDLMSNEANCGACGTVCGGATSATAVCGGGTCGLGCAVGSFDCDGSATNGCESTTACDPAVCQVAPFSELLITDLSVVEDPVRTTGNGAWTFGTLMREMNGGQDPSALVRNWLRTWEQPQFLGTTVIPPRPDIRNLVTNAWEARSGGASQPLDFNTAPFRLLAIVNRMDLRKEGVNAGEGRFVFGVLDPTGNPTPFTVIFEYVLPGGAPEEFQRWARDWHALGQTPFGSAYNAKLQGLTDRFTRAFAAPGLFLGSAISQVRTNENAMDFEWELREFHLDSLGLVPARVALTPEIFLNGSPTLVSYLAQNQADVLAGTHDVPALFGGQTFGAGSALTPFFFFWQAPGADPETRHQFSVNTCNGCHAGETRTPFLHVFPRSAGQATGLSAFLVGSSPIPDPATGVPRVFNDLGRRREDLSAMVCGEGPALRGSLGEELLAPWRAAREEAVPGFPPRSNLPPGRVH